MKSLRDSETNVRGYTRRQRISLVAAVFLFLLAPGLSVESRTVNVAIPCYCFQYLPFFIAKDKGYYRGEDIDAQIIVMGGGVGLRALIGSNVDFAATGEPAVLSA
ncbi:MAG: ABC transporter substrate-binding protein, partial [Candidatus Binatia bacterium]